jgi:hypothetical protein
MGKGQFAGSPEGLEAFLASHEGVLGPDVVGPFRVSAVSRIGRDAVRCAVAAHQLVPADPRDPASRDIYVPVPVSGWMELRQDGSLVAKSLEAPGRAETREARMFAQDLLRGGAVEGLPVARSLGPRPRPTHTLRTEAGGRRVIRRIGFTQT